MKEVLLMDDNQENVLIEAFQMMWGNYPEPVRLIHKSFRVVSGNAAYINSNGPVDVKCNATNPELHRGCKAMAALKDKETKIKTSIMNDVQWVSYWVPVNGVEDYFVHFTNGINEYMKKMVV